MKRPALFFYFFLLFAVACAQQYPNVQYDERLNELSIFVEKKLAMKIEAPTFSFHPELIVAQDASVTIYLDLDSIYHPCAEVSYNPVTTELWVSRTINGLGRAPFFDSYHKLEIKSDAIFWKMNTHTIEFRKSLFQYSDKPAFFQSQDYFDAEIMRNNKGYNSKNPMMQLWELFQSNKFKPLSFNYIAQAFRASHADMIALLIDYAVQGFVEYDIQTNIISYKSKLAHYLNNESKTRDYDNLYWESKSHFAALNMKNFDLTIHDCEFFVLSDRHIVNVYPANEIVVVKKNRNLHFSGRVIGGLFDFFARGCSFNYDKFQISMPQIDTMLMFSEDRSKSRNIYGEYPLKKVRSVVEEISGILSIDDPKNKSGNKDIPDYPIFESREGGKVFFDQPFVLNGEYKREEFYFQIGYFIIKNLDDFNIDSTKIAGRLVSGGIFPDIHEPLKLQPDNSLGFVHKTGSEGLPIYDGEARFYNTIELTSNGLRGKGKIDYLTSITETDSMVFYLKSVRGKANTFNIKPQLAKVEYPETSTKLAQFFFEPYKNEMRITSVKTPFSIFNESKFDGTLSLSPQHLKGNGILNFKRAELQSKLMVLKHHAVEAESSDLRIFENEKQDKTVFTTTNFLAKVDFKSRIGEFTSNAGSSEILFITNGLRTHAQAFSWNTIDRNLLHFVWNDPYKEHPLNATATRELVKMNSKGNILSTIEKGKREVSFNLQALDFDFEQKRLSAHGVRYIPVGDAAIFPKDGEVTIHENAAFQPLKNARILAARDNMYHELHNCSVNIEHGNDFTGSGDYNYVNEFDEVQTIHFDTLWYFDATKGTASLPAQTDFTLSPHFGFSGNVELNSTKQFLTFIGGVSILQNCNTLKFDPLRINQEINPKNILIEINDLSRDVNDRRATVAIASSNVTKKIYTCFGGAKEQVNDSEYINASGYITYSNEKQAFQAASLEKLNNLKLPGNMISLYSNACVSIGEGAIDMGAKLGRVKFKTFGQLVNYMAVDSAEMYLTTSIDFLFNNESMNIMNEHLTNAKAKFLNPNADQNFTKSLMNMMGEEAYAKYERDSRAGSFEKLPEQFNVKFLFSTLNFVWKEENAAFVSQRTLPVVVSGGRLIYKEIPGMIVIEKRGSKNSLFIYFEVGKEHFFFQFVDNILYAYSSDSKFNELISSTKAIDKILVKIKGESSFQYKLGKRGDMTRFVRKYYELPPEVE
jgi:hypothetical protein